MTRKSLRSSPRGRVARDFESAYALGTEESALWAGAVCTFSVSGACAQPTIRKDPQKLFFKSEGFVAERACRSVLLRLPTENRPRRAQETGTVPARKSERRGNAYGRRRGPVSAGRHGIGRSAPIFLCAPRGARAYHPSRSTREPTSYPAF